MTAESRLRRHLARLVLTIAMVAGGAAVVVLPSDAAPDPAQRVTPQAQCGPGSLPETDLQGRVPAADYASGRAAQGYRCNTVEIGHQGATGGFKTWRYVDAAGRKCAFYDSATLYPLNLLYSSGGEGTGVKVLDVSDPTKPRKTANLASLTMNSPHESLVLNEKRGLLAAVLGSPVTNLGIVEIYDVSENCLHPKLLATTTEGLLGHESGFAPDGNTLYITGTSGSWVAFDVKDASKPKVLYRQGGFVYHGLRLSDDGRTMYVANIGVPDANSVLGGAGLRILDVSEIQDRKPEPEVHVLADLSWPGGSIPQHADPITIKGHKYVLQMDEFANFGVNLLLGLGYDDTAAVGAARLINVDDPKKPFVVSDLRLAVNSPEARKGEPSNDPGARLPVQGYTGHYCSAPTRVDPGIVACSFVASGLRIFNIEDPANPREVAYFNKPAPVGNPARSAGWAMSAPAWDLANQQIYYTDANSGFYVVGLTNGVVPAKYLPSKPCQGLQKKVSKALGKDRLQFDHLKSAIKPKAAKELRKVAKLLKACKNAKLAVLGSTPRTSLVKAPLSLARAQSVKARLVKLGVKAKRINVRGVRDLKPLVKDRNSPRNRYVDIRLR